VVLNRERIGTRSPAKKRAAALVRRAPFTTDKGKRGGHEGLHAWEEQNALVGSEGINNQQARGSVELGITIQGERKK